LTHVRATTGADVSRQRDIVARLERLPISSWHVRARVLIGTATFFDGFDVLVITFVLPALVPLWNLGPQQVGLILSAGFAGQLIGALLAGTAAERFGRLRVVTITIAIFSIMSMFCALAWSPESLMAFRFLQGIGLGGEVPVAAAYISEIARAKGRGRFFTFYELLFPIGLFCAAVVSFWVVPNVGWRPMFWLGALPAVLVLFLRRALPESPRWLASRGRVDEADAVVTRIEHAITESGGLLPPVNLESASLPRAGKTRWQELFQGVYLQRTLVVWVLWFSCYLVTYGLTTWLPTLYRTVFKLPLERALGYALITNAVGLVGCILCAFLIDRLGRRRWFTMAFLAGGLSLCTLRFVDATNPVIVMACASASFFFISSISLTLYLYTSELYPTRMRAVGCGVASAWLRLASALGPSVVGFMLTTSGITSIFVLFGCIAAAGGVVIALWGTETRNTVLETVSP
jgi:putative MFS transporter